MNNEKQYLNLLKRILEDGESRDDRTGVGTISLFGLHMEFDLNEGFPLLTTKKTWFNGILKELLFFLSGKTDTKILERQGVNIWKDNTSMEFLAKNGLRLDEGDMGPGYSFQWRHAGEQYAGKDREYKGIDQIQQLIGGLKKNPTGRRHIVSSWDVANIEKMALPPCHCFFQMYVREGKYLDCCLYQRSADMFLGVPFNIASYALLMIIIGHLTDLVPGRLIHNLGDAHIYKNHIEQVKEQLTRSPYPSPTVEIKRKIESIDDFRFEDFLLENYTFHGVLKGDMAK